MSAEEHLGGCHCGRVRFKATVDLATTMTCNCSICQKSGTILTFAPAERFTLLSGEADLTEYRFNKKVIHHLFCKTCGVRSFSRGQKPGGGEMVAVNVRCLDDVDIASLTPKAVDGRSF